MFPCGFGFFGFMSIPGDFAVVGRFRRRFSGTFCSVSMCLFYMNLRENQAGRNFSRVTLSRRSAEDGGGQFEDRFVTGGILMIFSVSFVVRFFKSP